MRYEITLAPEAVTDLRLLPASLRASIRAALEPYLRHQPTRTSKSRIKRLRGMSRPQFRLRVGDVRVFYDVSESMVEVLGIVSKSEVEAWLQRVGEIDEEGTTYRSEE
jgi:mRNA interferase RelE/StbE